MEENKQPAEQNPGGENPGEQTPGGEQNPGAAKGQTDLEIENAALKELLAENKKTIDALNKTMAEVKTTNAKLLNQMNVGKAADVDSLMNDLFNKYARQK